MIAYELDWLNYVLGVYINYEKWDAQSDNYTKKAHKTHALSRIITDIIIIFDK